MTSKDWIGRKVRDDVKSKGTIERKRTGKLFTVRNVTSSTRECLDLLGVQLSEDLEHPRKQQARNPPSPAVGFYEEAP